jgi:hypothetical protein
MFLDKIFGFFLGWKNRLVLLPVSVSEAGIWTRQLFLGG